MTRPHKLSVSLVAVHRKWMHRQKGLKCNTLAPFQGTWVTSIESENGKKYNRERPVENRKKRKQLLKNCWIWFLYYRFRIFLLRFSSFGSHISDFDLHYILRLIDPIDVNKTNVLLLQNSKFGLEKKWHCWTNLNRFLRKLWWGLWCIQLSLSFKKYHLCMWY